MKTIENSYSVQEVQTDPLNFLRDLSQREGKDIVSYTVEGYKVVLVNHPDFIKKVLQTDDAIFVKDGTPEMMMLKPFLGNGLLTSTGLAWKEQRNVAREAFTMDKIASFITMMVAEAKDLTKNWISGDTIDIEQEMSELTLRIVSKALFGDSLNSVATEFGKSVRTINLFMGHFDPSDIEGRLAYNAALSWLRKVVKDLIDERRNTDIVYDDFLTTLLASEGKQGFSENDLIDQVFTFLMAGHETTAKTLTWTLYELYKNPTALADLEAELTQVLNGKEPVLQNISQLTITWNILQESMRLNPPVWIISRTALVQTEIDGVIIPAGALVLVSPYLIHRHTDYWDSPEIFNHERFLKQAVEARPVYSFIPFSGGPRHCVGKNFASMEVIAVLAQLVSHFRFELKKDFEVVKEALVTLRPKNGLLMRIVRK